MAKYKVEINSIENIRALLQETYILADEQLIQAQNEINKLANSTKLQDEIMDGKQKYAKAIQDYLSIKDKAISKKMDIARLLTELYKHNGNVEDTLNDASSMKSTSINWSELKSALSKEYGTDDKKENITLKNEK